MKVPHFFGVMMMVVPAVWAGEPYMDVDPQKLLCVGSQPASGYKQRCVARCVVNGLDGFTYVGKMTDDRSKESMEVYHLLGEYRCPKGWVKPEVREALLKDARIVAHTFCGKGNLVKVLSGPNMQSDENRAHAAILVGCKTAK